MTPCGLAGGCPSAFAQLGHSPIGVTAAGSESVPASTATRPRTYRTHCHSTLIVPIRYARCRVAVRAALPLDPERAVPYVHHRVAVYGVLPSTLDAEWQCTARRPARSPPSGSVSCTATRPRTYRTHCHSPLIVPMRYARCRVAVRAALPSTLTTEWQCESHCHSTPNVPDALPLDPERAVPYVHHRVTVYGVPPRTFTDEWQCTVRRQVRVINVFHMLADLLGGHPGPGAGEPRVGGRHQSPAWRLARPAGT